MRVVDISLIVSSSSMNFNCFSLLSFIFLVNLFSFSALRALLSVNSSFLAYNSVQILSKIFLRSVYSLRSMICLVSSRRVYSSSIYNLSIFSYLVRWFLLMSSALILSLLLAIEPLILSKSRWGTL